MSRILYILLTLLSMPSLVSASVDFTKTVSDNSMLLLFLISVVALIGATLSKFIWSKMDQKLEDQTKMTAQKEDEAHRSELRLKEQEIGQLKARVDRIEQEQNSCSRNLPMTYVTRQEYDKFVLQHREEFQSLMTRMEGMIREFRNEIKTDMQGQIDRIVDLITKLVESKE